MSTNTAAIPPIAPLRQTPPQSVAEVRRPPFDGTGNLEQEKLFPHSVRGRWGKDA
jgi:hypothetical protein